MQNLKIYVNTLEFHQICGIIIIVYIGLYEGIILSITKGSINQWITIRNS